MASCRPDGRGLDFALKALPRLGLPPALELELEIELVPEPDLRLEPLEPVPEENVELSEIDWA